MKKAIFICKPSNLTDVCSELEHAAETGRRSEPYKVLKTRKVTAAEWNSLTESFLADRDWLSAFRAALEKRPEKDLDKRGCIRVVCEGKNISLLIDTQGYDYARYVAIENS